jgi:hypothetical protein
VHDVDEEVVDEVEVEYDSLDELVVEEDVDELV